MARSVGPAPSHQPVIHGVPELCQPPTLLFADLVGTVLLVLPAAMGGPLWTVVAGIVAAGAGASLWSVLVAALRQERTPPALLGRVYSASRVPSWGALPLGSALAAFLAHWLDVGQILGAAAVLAIMTAAWFPLLRINRHIAAEDTQVSLKELGRPLPDFSNSPDPDAQV